ncbi:ferritin-like domain-containing protein [Bradyrhizobium cenepequi]|uniref:ferritin-like domain-containing protein n=1 Tax=Bradyrhizobium cenepequi TaxID=2821403 RepID=UPI001CE35176|nr:ferritin family protein [Bradyrhizobium cenepequi]MCA6107088.1 ferritin family protein [Bradyrhizobium cenepequi]
MLLMRTLLLKNEPAGTLHSLEELFALASAMEKEAADRYSGLAEDMQAQNRADLAAVFAQLAAAEREHVDSVTRWSQSRRGKAPDPALVRWDAPETFDVEAMTEIKASRLITPYRALAMAVRNEERAFAFWSYIAAFTADLEIRKAAEAMAREELVHVATLRKERRSAYRREHKERTSEGAADAIAQVDAGALESRLAVRLADLEARLQGHSRSRVHELCEEAQLMSTRAAGLGSFPAALQETDAQTIAEALTDAYLDGAERSDDPTRLELLQMLAQRAIARLAWLRSLEPVSPSGK